MCLDRYKNTEREKVEREREREGGREREQLHQLLCAGSQILGQDGGILAVDVRRYVVELGDESMLDPIHGNLGSSHAQNQRKQCVEEVV